MTILVRNREYEVVNYIPDGFAIWNIRRIRDDDRHDYIPLVEASKEGWPHINPNTLKAIRLPIYEARKLRDAASYAIDSLSAAMAVLNLDYEVVSQVDCIKIELAKDTINIFKRLTKGV